MKDASILNVQILRAIINTTPRCVEQAIWNQTIGFHFSATIILGIGIALFCSREIRPPAGILCRSEMEFSKEEEEEIWTVEKSPSSSSASSLLEAGGGVRTPSAAEIEELFSASEKYQQKFFREKYNYDVEKDLPLEGRYEWVPFKEEAAAPPPRCSAIEVVKGREDERA
ncbi:hypothetical protein DM860_003211 [Cuscuta australis]|uniref:Cyclin-dependent kinase inhibitor domain-containing protein n=1 Tax=Cuscuta australis TaxID=267555 RepID=A0A328D5F6_9ASTE|nr:hypothetical protein DM860_003211 [Cuscuta australis]